MDIVYQIVMLTPAYAMQCCAVPSMGIPTPRCLNVIKLLGFITGW